jgi:hypothetical protein
MARRCPISRWPRSTPGAWCASARSPPASWRRSATTRSARQGITAYLANGGSLEHAQSMAAHESPRTTKLYGRTKERLTQDEIERIVM